MHFFAHLFNKMAQAERGTQRECERGEIATKTELQLAVVASKHLAVLPVVRFVVLSLFMFIFAT